MDPAPAYTPPPWEPQPPKHDVVETLAALTDPEVKAELEARDALWVKRYLEAEEHE